MKFYSSRGEDKWIYKNLVLPKKGFYVDIGAAHPTRMSNTAFLRDRGWAGIQIDADPFWIPYWNKIGLELINKVVTDENKPIRFEVNKSAHRLSKISRHGERTLATTLNRLFTERCVPHINFMSLDVEGWEYDIFRTLDKKYWPDILVSEYVTLGVEDNRLFDFLHVYTSYTLAYISKSNYIYIQPEVGVIPV